MVTDSKFDEWKTLLDSVLQDARFAVRTFGRNRKFTAVAILTLALCIGSTSGIFSVVHSVLFRPLPFQDPDRLTVLLSTAPRVRGGFFTAPGVFLDWRDRATSFENLAALRRTTVLWSGIEQTQEVPAASTTSGLFPLLGIPPVLGRGFTEQENREGHNVVLLDAGFWQKEFGGSPAVLNRTIVLDGSPHTIVGVVPAGIRSHGSGPVDVWLPLVPHRGHRGGGDLWVLGRLRPGITTQQAQAEMDAVTRIIGREHQEDSGHGIQVMPVREWMVQEVRRPFLAVLGAVVFVLLIGCSNIGGLLAARMSARRREMAIRASLGAGRARLLRQMLVESALLSLAGGTLGMGLAFAIVRLAPRISIIQIPRSHEIGIDIWLFAAGGLVSVASAILFSVAPALVIGRRNLHLAANQGDQSAGKTGGNRVRSVLVTAQVALALILLSGAGLLTNSLVRLLRIDLGFNRSALVTVHASLPSQGYEQSRALEFYRRLAEAVKRLPGVKAVSTSDWPPLMPVHFPYSLAASNAAGRATCEAEARHVDPGYLETTGIPLLAGRDLEPGDDNRLPTPVLINKAAARLLFGQGNPVGRHLTSNYTGRRAIEVVGLVGEARQLSLTEAPGPQIYVPLVHGSANYLVVRTAADNPDLTGDIRAAVRALDSRVPVPAVSRIDEAFDRQVATPRFYMILLSGFALAGLFLALLGVYGVLAYTVERRTQEFGVRMAIGATGKHITRLLLGFGLRLTMVGICLGIFGAAVLTRLLASLLYEVRPNDPLTLGAVTAGLAIIVFSTCWIAARRAARIDPLICLRSD